MSVYAKERPEWFALALDSVFRQTQPPTEVVLVEDGVLPQVLEAVVRSYEEQYDTLRVVRCKENRGLGAALNTGLQHCQCELVARMDTDDICKPQRFERQLRVFEERPDVDVCSAWIDEFEEDPQHVVSLRKVPEDAEVIAKYAKKRCPVNHVAVMYRRSKVLSVGGYQSFPEDYYLWVKLLLAGCKFYNVQESLLWVRFDPAVIKRRGGWKYAMDDLRAQRNFYKAGFLSLPEALSNATIRVAVRMFPNSLRGWFYRTFLRTHNQ